MKRKTQNILLNSICLISLAESSKYPLLGGVLALKCGDSKGKAPLEMYRCIRTTGHSLLLTNRCLLDQVLL